jgi:hypothetical protein
MIKQRTGWADERTPLEIFLIAGLLAYEHDFSTEASFAENGLSSTHPQVASFAAGCNLAQLMKACTWRNEFGCSTDLDGSRHV